MEVDPSSCSSIISQSRNPVHHQADTRPPTTPFPLSHLSLLNSNFRLLIVFSAEFQPQRHKCTKKKALADRQGCRLARLSLCLGALEEEKGPSLIIEADRAACPANILSILSSRLNSSQPMVRERGPYDAGPRPGVAGAFVYLFAAPSRLCGSGDGGQCPPYRTLGWKRVSG